MRLRIDWFALALSSAVFIGMLTCKRDVIPVVIGSGVLGLIYRYLLSQIALA